MSKVHVLTLIHSEGTSLTSAVPALQAALLQAGGHLVMPYLMGDAVVMDSKQVPRGDSASWDFILTRHQSVEAYLAATKSKDYLVAKSKSEQVLAYGFKRMNAAMVIIPAMLKVFGFLQSLVGANVNIERVNEGSGHTETVTVRGQAGPVDITHYEKHLADSPQKSFVMVNLIQSATTPKGKKAAMNYQKRFFKFAMGNGVYGIHGGSVFPLDADSGTETHSFDRIILVHYPSREIFIKMSRSEYFQRALDEKLDSVIDTQAFIALYTNR